MLQLRVCQVKVSTVYTGRGPFWERQAVHIFGPQVPCTPRPCRITSKPLSGLSSHLLFPALQHLNLEPSLCPRHFHFITYVPTRQELKPPSPSRRGEISNPTLCKAPRGSADISIRRLLAHLPPAGADIDSRLAWPHVDRAPFA